jgi:hypothetical protein
VSDRNNGKPGTSADHSASSDLPKRQRVIMELLRDEPRSDRAIAKLIDS